jgi:hypothetical protein
MELFQRLFGATRDASALPNFDARSKAVNVSATILRECIDLGFAGPGGPIRGRLAKPFARGYIFGFADACIQRFGVLDELESLAFITVVHAKLFGHKIGSLLVGDALRDERNAEFGRGRTAGAEDLLRWLDDRLCPAHRALHPHPCRAQRGSSGTRRQAPAARRRCRQD